MSDAAQAFEWLVEMLDEHIAAANERGTAAFQKRDTAAIEQASAAMQELDRLQRDVLALQQRWEALLPSSADDEESEAESDDTGDQRAAAHDRRREGLQLRERTTPEESFDVGNVSPPTLTAQRRIGRTPERAFYAPILRALTNLGGRGSLLAVIGLVEKELQAQFSVEDLQTTPQTSELRWRNTLRWARRDLVKRGWLRDSVNKGIWEISEAGRKWLAEQE